MKRNIEGEGFPDETTRSERRLESSEDDETLDEVKYFLHGTGSLIDSEDIRERGLRAREGRATLSTDLEHAFKWSVGENRHYSESQTERADDEIGTIFVFRRPKKYRVDYGLFTDAVIKGNEVTGNPVKYASGRKQLALFGPASSREGLQKKTKEQRETLLLSPDNIEAVIKPSEELSKIVRELSKEAKSLHNIDISYYSKIIMEALLKDPGNIVGDNIADICRQLTVTTIESVVISKMRNLYLDILAHKGYAITENGEPQKRERDEIALKSEVSALYDRCHHDNFDIGIEWLNKLIKNKLEELQAEIK